MTPGAGMSELRAALEAELALLPNDGPDGPRDPFYAGCAAAYNWCLAALASPDPAPSEEEWTGPFHCAVHDRRCQARPSSHRPALDASPDTAPSEEGRESTAAGTARITEWLIERDRERLRAESICGMVVEGGPNGEPLACAYPPNPPGERMHVHSWATLPTFAASAPSEERLRAALEWALDNLAAEDEVLGEPVPGEQTTYAVTVRGETTTMARSTQYAEHMAKARRLLASPDTAPSEEDEGGSMIGPAHTAESDPAGLYDDNWEPRRPAPLDDRAALLAELREKVKALPEYEGRGDYHVWSLVQRRAVLALLSESQDPEEGAPE